MRLHHRFAITGLGASLLLLAWPTPALAGTRQFSANSLIIAMDLCYQPTTGIGGWSGGNLPAGFAASYCPDPVPTAHDGVLKAYGLMYTFLQNSIPVHYIIDPTRTTIAGVDLTVTKAGSHPVYRVVNSKATKIDGTQYTDFMKAGNNTISFRGAPFVIDVSDATAALKIISDDAASAAPQFTNVNVYWAQTNFNAPEKGVLIGPPPKIALNGLDPTNVTILEAYLTAAGLQTTSTVCNILHVCTTTNTIDYWPTIGAAFTVLGISGKVADYTTSNALSAGNFKVVWSPHWEGVKSINGAANSGINTVAGAQTALNQVLGKMAAFADAGNSTFAECIGMGTIEGVAPVDGAPAQGGFSNGHFLTKVNTAATQGYIANNLGGGYPKGHAGETFATEDPIDPIVQIGDYVFSSVSGYTEDFHANTNVTYVPGTKRLLYTVAPANEATWDNRDIAVHGYKDGDAKKGQVVYLAGHSYAAGAGTTAGIRIPLNTLLFLGQINVAVELTRSAPIVYSDGKTYLGTYVQESMGANAYPPWKGHFREYPASSVSGANVTAFGILTADWDASTHVTTQAAADTRTIFTAVSASGTFTHKDFITANAVAIGTSTATITAIRQGGLGGVDHSIPAIIPPSQVAGSSSRPTVGYVGGLDGMLHAFLISGSVSGKTPGDEMWAFIPPSQLTGTIGYSGGVDGSPSVGDAFIDTGSGVKSWRTLLAVPDGNFTGGTLDVIDITDPTAGNAKFLWEASDSVTVSGKTYKLGRAQGAAIAPVMTTTGVAFAYFLATDNPGGVNGFNLYALDAGKGTVLWRFNHTYANDTTHNDVPGTVAVIDAAGDGGPVTKVYFGDIEGKVWAIDAATGLNATTIYDAAAANGAASSVDYPIESGVVLYRDPSNSHLDVLGITGGADWVNGGVISHVFKVDTTTSTGTNLLNLNAGERAYAVPTIYGNSAYIITSQGNLQGSIGTDFSSTGGSLIRINLGSTTGSTTIATVKAGASEVAVDASGNVVAASTSGLTQNTNGGQDKSQAVIALQNVTAKLLTVRAWLDLH